MLPEEKEKLLEYLKTAIAIETDIEKQSRIKEATLDEFKARMPILTQAKVPEFPEPPTVSKSDKSSIILSILFGTIGIVLGIVLFSNANGMQFLPFFCFFGGSCSFLWTHSMYMKIENARSDFSQKEQTIKSNREHIIEQNKHLKEVYSKQFTEWENSKQRILNSMVEPFEKTNDIRNQLYAQGLIYQKYLNLPALTSIYEYFITGRCDDLTGPHGAYNMYEDEVRKDTVISQLNAVIENLDQIKQNQYMLYQQVKSIQQTTGAVLQELSQIKGYTIAMTELTALTAYYTALNERNSRIMTYYHLVS